MTAYTVHAPGEEREPAAENRLERAVFIKDGISWPALFVPALWLLWHRLWLALIGWITFALVVAWIGRLLGDDAAGILAVLGQILFALEANNIRRWSLARRGWTDIGGSFGKIKDEAEIRFFAARAETPPQAAPGPPDRRVAVARPAHRPADDPVMGGQVLGLFPEAER